MAYNKNNLYKTLDYCSIDMLKSDFLENDLEIVSLPHFVYDFSRKMFLMLYSTNWPNFINWLPLLLEMLGNMCITIVYFPDCGVINFEINLFFLIQSFFYFTKKSRQKFKIFRPKRAFKLKWKAFFTVFYLTFSCQKPESTSLKSFEQLDHFYKTWKILA